MRISRLAAVATALALALPAGAYVPPASAVLRRVAQKRDELKVSSLEVRGGLSLPAEVAQQVQASTGLPGIAPEAAVPALLSVKAPGRCRLELAPDGVPPAQRPWVAWRNGAVTGRRGLEAVGAARAMVEAVCVLLGERAESERSLSQRLARHGVDVHEVAFGRLQGRVAWVIGGRQETRAQAWIDKLTFQPARLVASLAGARRDVRLLGFGGPAGGERFPAAVEVWTGGRLEARFSTVTVKVNPPLSDALFQ